MSEQGHFTWNEWAAALADELQDAVRRGEPDDGSRYYEHWPTPLENLVAGKGLTDSAALLTRKKAWVSRSIRKLGRHIRIDSRRDSITDAARGAVWMA